MENIFTFSVERGEQWQKPNGNAQSVPHHPKGCKEMGEVSQVGVPIYVKHVMRWSLALSPETRGQPENLLS